MSGIVVTHGTARLEETAFFLYLTIKSDRPVVVVGAQRPPTGISPDGPINLLSAIRVAAAPESRGKGVTAVMDDRIISARDVTKVYARGGGFEGAEMGMLGTVTGGARRILLPARQKHTVSTGFRCVGRSSCSRGSASATPTPAPRAWPIRKRRPSLWRRQASRPRRTSTTRPFARKGVIVATTFPSGEQVGDSPRSAESALPPVIAVKHLMPTKARILMMLALTRTQNPSDIQKIFDSY